jgi:hypothetical protein
MPIMGRLISCMARRVASRGDSPRWPSGAPLLHHHDGIVDDDADGQHHAEHGQYVDGKPASAITASVPSSAMGATTAGISV